MSLSAFGVASRVSRREDGAYSCHVPDGWQQGRGAFGGLVLGTLARAMEDVAGADGRSLRSLTGDLCGPALTGEGTIVVTTLRRGKGVTFVNAVLEQAGAVVARASAAFALSRSMHTPVIATHAPTTPPWRDVPVAPMGSPTGRPVFTQHYEYRSTGPAPFARGAEAACAGWVREVDAVDAPLDAPAIIALLDAWWPATFSIDEVLHPAATITFTAELLTDPASLHANEPLQYVARDVAAHDGFFVELRELWSNGQLVALNQQTFAILG